MLIKRDVDGKAQSFPNGEVPAIIGTFTYTAKRMGGAPSITATIYYPTPLDKQWTHAEYVEFQGERYYATSIPSSSKDNQSVLYKHDVTFTSRREILDNTLFFDAVSNKDEDTKGGDRYRTNQTRFSFGGDITEFVSRINSSMKYCEVPYSVVIDDGYATTDVKEVSFENQYLTEVLQLINTTYQLDYYWVGNVCHVGKLQYDLTDNPIEYGRNDALVSVSKENSNARIVDMITGYGSSDNIPYYYPNDDEFGKADYISENINEPIAISLPQLQKNANIGTDYAKKYTLYKREGALKATIKIDGSFFGTMPSSKLVVADGMDFDRMAIIPIVAKKGMKIYEPKITVSHHTLKSGVSIKSDVFSFYMDNETEGNYNGSYTFTNDRYAALVIWEKITIKSTIGDVAVDKSISYNYIGSVEIEYENQSKAFWLFDGGVIEYESSGISVNNIDNVTSAKSLVTFEKIPNADNTSFWWGFKETYDTSTEEAAAKITIKGRTWIFPSQNLMPSVYRESGGAERFYYAKNDTYSIPGATDKYTFKNIYKEGNPHQGSVEFSDIKPTINGVRNDVIQSDGLGQLFGEIADVAFDSNDSDVKNDDSEYIHSYFYIKLHKFSGSYGFDLFKHALASESAKINLIKSNGCPACSFDIQCVPSKDKSKMYNCVSTDGHGNLKSVRDDCNDYIFKNEEDAYKDTFNQDSTKTELWIAVKKDDSTLGIIMPNASGNFKPQKGDLFVITGINPPKVLVTAAEKRLDEALIKYMSENNEDKFNYSVKFSRIFLQENMAFANKLNENSKVAITYAGEKHEFFVTNYTVKVDDSALADVEIELSDTLDASSSELKKVIDAVKGDTVAQLKGLIGGSGGLNATIANRLYLSKQGDDTAQGLITFAKGLISNVLVKLKGGATFGTRGYKFDEKGNVVVDALSSLTFDEALERGFGITKNAQGKYTLSVTDLMVWGKAVFNSLEIRKLYAVGGNVYLSGASSKIVRAVPVKKATAAASSTGGDASETWVACAEGDADCEGWKCYTLNDDGTTATQNGWRKYDQAKCQTFDIEAGTHEGVSNTYYWRLVADVSTKNETITETRTEAYVDDDGVTKTREVTVDLYDGKKFGWVVLSKTDCESTTNDAPKAGDTIVLDGHRMFASGDAEGRDQYNDESRTNVMMLETTGTQDGTLPRIVALTGIVDYKHSEDDNHPYSNTVFTLSPKEVVFVSSCFKFIGASGEPITLVNFRGNWEEGKEYAYYDQVSHNDSIWTCIVEKGKKTTEEPSDTSKVWRKEISGGKGEKGDKGDPGTPGNGIDHVETRFFAWKSDTFGTGFDSDRVWEDGSTTMPADFSDDFPWLWQVTRTYYTNGTDVLGEAVCIGYKGKDAVTYGVQLSSTYEVFSDAKKHAGIKVAYTKTTGMTVSSYDNVQVLGTAKVYADGMEIKSASDHLKDGYNRIIFDYYTFDGTNNTASIGTARVITVELLVGDTVVATANYSNGKQGDGVVMAYKHADTQPDVPTGTDPEHPGDGWSLSPDAATAGEKVTDVRYGGYESGTYDGNNKGTDATAKEWAEAEDDGRTWMKSPSGLSDYGYAMMKVSFITQYDNTTVDVDIKAYSEQNFDLVEVWALDTAPSTGTSFRGQGLAHASGNGVEQAYSFTVAKAGRHFICVTYAKDTSGDDNGDYGLFRLDLSDTEVAISDTVWMSQAKVSGGKCVLPWSTPVKINGADGSAATVYTIETVGNSNNSGTLTDASTILVTLDGNLKLYKTVGSEKTEDSRPPQCWRLTLGGKNLDGVFVFDNSAGNNIISYRYSNGYEIDSNGNSTAPGSATISVYRDSSMSELLASLVVPIALNPGAIVNVDAKLGKIESTTAGMQGTIETIKQGQGQISLKVQDLQNGGVGTSKPHTSSQVNFKTLDGNIFYPVMIRFKDDGGMRHTVEINRPLDGTYGSDKDYMTHGNGFSFRLIFSDIANCWGSNEEGQLRIESISQRWTEPTDTPICPKIEQYNTFSFIVAWLRGGSKYDITVDCTDAYISGIWPYMMQVASDPSWVPDAVRLANDTWTTAQVNAQAGNPDNMLRKDNGGYYADVDNEFLYRFGELAAGNTFAIVGQPTDSKVWFLATWHITSVSESKVYVDVSTDGLLWQAQNPLGIRMNGGLGYIKTGASYAKSTWDSQSGFGSSESIDDTAVHANWETTKSILVIGTEQEPTNGVYRDRAVLEAVQSCTEGSSVTFYRNTYFDASPLYGTDGRTNVKPDLLATGIDIKSHKITATADKFVVQNNSGDQTFSIDEDGNIVGERDAMFKGAVTATTFTLSSDKFYVDNNGKFKLNMTNFSVDENGNITAKGGRVSFFNFDEEGMASGVVLVSDSSQNKKAQQGLGLSLSNISVSGSANQRISSVFLGNGRIDSRFAGLDDNHTVYRVGPYPLASTFYNYIKLEKLGNGSDSLENNPEHAALGIETQGDFCLAALGGPSLFAGMCFASNTGGSSSADKNHCFYLCEGGTFKMPSDTPDGMLIVVIKTGRRIDFNGNGHMFQSGTYNSLSFTSDSAGQWSLFYYHNGVWYTIYMTR